MKHVDAHFQANLQPCFDSHLRELKIQEKYAVRIEEEKKALSLAQFHL